VFCVDLRTNSDYFTVQHGFFFTTETECVYCAVRTGSLNIIPVSFSLVRQCRGLSPRRPRFDPTAVYVRLVVLANVYFPSTSAVPCRYHSANVGIIPPMSVSFHQCRYHSANAQYSLSSTLWPYHKNKQVNPGNLLQINALSVTGQRWRCQASLLATTVAPFQTLPNWCRLAALRLQTVHTFPICYILDFLVLTHKETHKFDHPKRLHVVSDPHRT
jgi:hypothetical protein